MPGARAIRCRSGCGRRTRLRYLSPNGFPVSGRGKTPFALRYRRAGLRYRSPSTSPDKSSPTTAAPSPSETAVAGMTDVFVLLQLPNAGDDLQAIKKGVMELADLVVINKADIDPAAATRAQATITSALRLFSFHGQPAGDHARARVMQASALKGDGIATFWQHVAHFQQRRRASGEFESRRRKQALAWMWDLIQARLQADFKHHPAVRAALPDTLRDVADARVAPSAAAHALLAPLQHSPNDERPHD